jgi:hypothetical protein
MFAYFKLVRFSFREVFSRIGSVAVSTSDTCRKAFRNIYHPSLQTNFSNVGRNLHHSMTGVQHAKKEEEKQKVE